MTNNNNNVSMNNNNLNQFSDPCTSPQSRLAQQQQQQQPHLQEEVGTRAQCCCCCAAAALVTSQVEDERAPVAADRRRQERRPGTSSELETSTQSGFESGNERSHCCSASKLSTSSQQQQQQHQDQCNESSPHRYCNDSSFGSEDVGSKPCQEFSRGRNVRVFSQGNCVESGEQKEQVLVLSDQCFREENESEDCVDVQLHIGSRQHCENIDKMRLVKKCSLGDEGERSFPSAGAFEASPRWSGLTGVPGLGASIHQVIDSATYVHSCLILVMS